MNKKELEIEIERLNKEIDAREKEVNEDYSRFNREIKLRDDKIKTKDKQLILLSLLYIVSFAIWLLMRV